MTPPAPTTAPLPPSPLREMLVPGAGALADGGSPAVEAAEPSR